ncbi:MAG: hypothetical protein ACK4K3_07550 [Aquabacterium sp.]
MSESKQKKPALERFMTPLGVLVFPKLNTPDEYKGKKTWQAPLRVNREEAAALLEKYDAAYDAAWEEAQAQAQERLDNAKTGAEKQKAKKALEALSQAAKAYEVVLDDDGEETDEVILRIKMNAEVEKDGKVRSLKPDFFDAKGKPLKTVPQIRGGTKVYISGQFNPYNSTTGVGVSLRLNALQIIELSNGGSRDASAYGFGAQDGGFSADDVEEEEGTFPDRSGGDGSGTQDPDDF